MSFRPQRQNSEILQQVYAQKDGMPIWVSSDSAQYPRSSSTTTRGALSSKPRLFALIIAINNYKSEAFHRLRGAVSDALSIKEYLISHLKVPEEQTTLLLNEHATRSAIVNAFTKLANDPRIERGDAIVIYYAGHGGEITPSPEWEAGGPGSKIQMLVPYDYCSAQGRQVPGIPDFTIGALIERIARPKGDNITVIFDCCNSASGTRSLNNDNIVRAVELDDGVYNQAIDETILYDGTRGSRPAPQFRHGGSKSHVLIAACGSAEQARESNGHGNFSTALLKLFRTISPDKLRYSDVLIQMDPIPGQNPQCEGVNRNRILFNSKVLPQSRECYPVRLERHGASSWRLILKAGSAHGITAGAEFMVFLQSDTGLRHQTAVVSVEHALALTSILRTPRDFTLDQESVAVQTRAGRKEDLRLYVPPQDPFRNLFRLACESEYRSHYCLDNITVVEHPQDAHLSAHLHVSRNNKKVIFDLMDERVTRFGFRHQFASVDADLDVVASVLGQAGHFYRTLNRANSGPGVTGRIQVEFYRLHEPLLVPDGPNLYRNGIVDLVIDEDDPYGLKIVNNSDRDFYAHLFYFDNSDLSISSYYESPCTSREYKPDVCLKKHGGFLTVGYGAGGVRPFSYIMPPRQDMDVGFIKLFLSTEPIDLSDFPQKTPFLSTRATKVWAGRSKATWDSILIPVIQRRHSAESHKYSKKGK